MIKETILVIAPISNPSLQYLETVYMVVKRLPETNIILRILLQSVARDDTDYNLVELHGNGCAAGQTRRIPTATKLDLRVMPFESVDQQDTVLVFWNQS